MTKKIDSLSLTELEALARDLRRSRTALRRTGKVGVAYMQALSHGERVRVEYPTGSKPESITPLLMSLGINDLKNIIYTETPRITAGARVFIGDTLYDGSYTTLTQKI